MPKEIETKSITIKELFSNTQNSILASKGIFAIPEYQRPYSWIASEQCDKLWQDLEVASENSYNETAYFLGSIIIDNADNESQGSNLHNLIDGQQRVTTFFLLMKALLMRINEILKSIPNDEDSQRSKSQLEDRRKDLIRCIYLMDDDDIFDVLHNKRQFSEFTIKYCNNAISELYKDELAVIINGQNYEEIENTVKHIKFKKSSNKYTNFYKNFLFFVEKFKGKEESYIRKFANDFLTHCQVIAVISYQNGEAIDIFNSLNSTGMPLSDADVISANLHKGTPQDKKDDFKKNWGAIVQDTNILQTRKIVDIDDIFNQYMYIKRAEKGESSTTLPGVRKYFLSINSDMLKNSENFIEDLQSLIEIWKFDQAPKTKEEQNLNNVKQVLLKNNSNFKFFLATYLYFNKNDSDTEKLLFAEELLKLFTILSVPNTTETYSSSNFKQFLINLNMEIGKGLTCKDIILKIHTHIVTKFKKDVIKQNLIDYSVGGGIVYLNEYLFAKENDLNLDLTVGNIEIEHVMPASGKNLPAIKIDAGMDENEFDATVNLIGNKILLEQNINGSISNEWFKLKKQSSINDKCGYKDSHFPIAQSLINYHKDVWTKNDIESATEKAATRITDFIFN